MRDRREVLKLLAGGTAAAAGATLITKSHAFADSGTAGCLPTAASFPSSITGVIAAAEVLQNNGESDYVRITVNPTSGVINSIACPTNHTKSLEYRWSVNVAGATIISDSNTSLNFEDVFTSLGAVVRVVDSGQTMALSDGSYVVTLQLRVKCTQGSRVCWRCVGYQVTFGWNRDEANASDGFTSGPTESTPTSNPNCND